MRVKFVGAGALVFLVGCGAEITADVSVGAADGAAIVEAFFAKAVRENQPILQSEDTDGDGNLDVNEDVDGDFNLDVAEDANNNGILDPGEDLDLDGNLDVDEDIDGDGNLDVNDEDINGDGLINVTEADINGDGVINDADNATVSLFIIAGSGGALDCQGFTDAFLNQVAPTVDDTIMFSLGIQASVGPNIPDTFVEGNTITPSNVDPTNLIQMQAIFGQIVDGQTVAESSAAGQDVTLTIDKLNGKLTGSLQATLQDSNNAAVSLNAEFKRIEECQALSDGFQAQLDAGNFGF